ncbi:glutamate/aspartate transport system substrate-binding protein [Pseudochelatococcus contaminans]|uniref:Glutamate/aspartate transport system substrate-binding protein n=2 Tax=Pseudochelatococcus contaminans TaxID=1538103 RepID=A0A7W5Z8S9_9HYPH|nr:glutamate/aspartate transport system substrate-binding protein [Pseudochelatococcus contaminans]
MSRMAKAVLFVSFVATPTMALAAGTLDKIKETGKITIGHREASIPFSFLDQNQKPVGFANDICLTIAEAVKEHLKLDKLEVVLTPVTSATRIPLIANGTVDLECGSTTNNLERQKQAAFTNTHYLTANRFVAKKDSGLTTFEDLAGKTVASTSGTTNIVQLNNYNAEGKRGITIIPVKDHAEGFLMVETGRAAAFVMDDILLSGLVAGSRSPSDYALSEDALSKPEPYGIMLRRDDPEFKAVVDAATAKLYTSPDMQTLYAKWFLSPIPPRGLTLNVPLGEALAKAFANPSDSADPDSY